MVLTPANKVSIDVLVESFKSLVSPPKLKGLSLMKGSHWLEQGLQTWILDDSCFGGASLVSSSIGEKNLKLPFSSFFSSLGATFRDTFISTLVSVVGFSTLISLALSFIAFISIDLLAVLSKLSFIFGTS